MRALCFKKIGLLFLIFQLSQAVAQNAGKSSKPELTPQHQPKRATEGSLSKDKPHIFPFYFWRRVNQTKDSDPYKLFLTHNDGTISEEKKLTVTYEEAFEEATKKTAVVYTSAHADEVNSSTPSATPILKVSPSQKWKIIVPGGQQEEGNSVQVLNEKSSSPDKVDIPEDGWFWTALFWNPVKDLFYFSVYEGDSTGHYYDYYQFEPTASEFTFIGGGILPLEVSPDGEWIVWNDGEGKSWFDYNIHAYEVKSNTNYVLTTGHSDNIFYKWANDRSVEKWDEINACIQAGKNFYFKNDFKKAIAEYQKAIDLDPKNGTAYGLKGYSCLREGRIDEAEKSLLKANEINHRDRMSNYNLSLVYWAKKDVGKAVLYLEYLYLDDGSYKGKVEKDPQFKDIIRTKEYLKMIRGRWDHSSDSGSN